MVSDLVGYVLAAGQGLSEATSGWVWVAGTVVAGLVSAPWLAIWIQRRELSKLQLATAARTTAEGKRTDAETDLTRYTVVRDLLDRLTAETAEQRRRIQALEEQARIDHELQMAHALWDITAVTQLRQQGIEVAAPPPLRMTGRHAATAEPHDSEDDQGQ